MVTYANHEDLVPARLEEEIQIGRAFAEELIPIIRDAEGKVNLDHFAHLPHICDDQYKWLLERPSVVHGKEEARKLAKFGITPMEIEEACQSVSSVVHRHCEYYEVKTVLVSLTDNRTLVDGPDRMERKHVITEIALSTELGEVVALCIFSFLCKVVVGMPALFRGFESVIEGEDLILTRRS